MTIREYLKQFIVSFTREVLAMWFAFRDRRVHWYVKLVIAFGVLYTLSPYDLISDTVPIWGQVDDIIVLRISYLVSRKIIDPLVLDECRSRATAFLDTGKTNRVYYVSVVLLVWGAALLLMGRFLARKFAKL